MKLKIQMKGLYFNKEAVKKLNDGQMNQLKGGGRSSKDINCSCVNRSCDNKSKDNEDALEELDRLL